jgi:hypothetical protein
VVYTVEVVYLVTSVGWDGGDGGAGVPVGPNGEPPFPWV